LLVGSTPEAGDLVPESGGIRKLRWAAKGKGKSGGVRVIYYFHSEALPVFLLTVYAKNQRGT
jgi:mRNA-degrading endonuclease RelE of RelBE toxin-antitoxin system